MEQRGVDDYMRLSYRMEVYRDGDYWAAEFPELPGLAAGHETWDGLLAMVEDAKRAYFTAMLGDSLPIPEPNAHSGRFVVRVPKSLHADLVIRARREGVSLNTLCVAALARAIEEAVRVAMESPAWQPMRVDVVGPAVCEPCGVAHGAGEVDGE